MKWMCYSYTVLISWINFIFISTVFGNLISSSSDYLFLFGKDKVFVIFSYYPRVSKTEIFKLVYLFKTEPTELLKVRMKKKNHLFSVTKIFSTSDLHLIIRLLINLCFYSIWDSWVEVRTLNSIFKCQTGCCLRLCANFEPESNRPTGTQEW